MAPVLVGQLQKVLRFIYFLQKLLFTYSMWMLSGTSRRYWPPKERRWGGWEEVMLLRSSWPSRARRNVLNRKQQTRRIWLKMKIHECMHNQVRWLFSTVVVIWRVESIPVHSHLWIFGVFSEAYVYVFGMGRSQREPTSAWKLMQTPDLDQNATTMR